MFIKLADSLIDSQGMQTTAVLGTVSFPFVLSTLVLTFQPLFGAVGRFAVIRRPADRWMFIHLPVSPAASAPHSTGSVKLSVSHHGFITSQSLIVPTQGAPVKSQTMLNCKIDGVCGRC